MTNIRSRIVDSAGRGVGRVSMSVQLLGVTEAWKQTAEGKAATKEGAALTDASGWWTVNLTPYSRLPIGSWYHFVEQGPDRGSALVTRQGRVPDGAGPFELQDILLPGVPDPSQNPSGQAAQQLVDGPSLVGAAEGTVIVLLANGLIGVDTGGPS